MENHDKRYPSIEVPHLKRYRDGVENEQLPEVTAYEYMYQNNKNYPNDIALEYFGNKISYGYLLEAIEIAAKSFKNMGVEKGTVVTLGMFSIPEMIYIWMALNRIGAVANFINPAFSDEQKIKLINDTKSTLFIAQDKIYSKFKDAIKQTSIENTVVISSNNSLPTLKKLFVNLMEIVKNDGIDAKDAIKYKTFTQQNGYNGSIDVEYEKDRANAMVYTSGTSTGVPSGIVLSDSTFVNMTFMHELSGMDFSRGNRNLNVIPPIFSTGLNPSLYLSLSLGVTTILDPRAIFDRKIFLDNVFKTNPQYIIAPISSWEGFLLHPEIVDKLSKDHDLSHVLLAVAGGEPLTPEFATAIFDVFKKCGFLGGLSNGYGQCQFGGGVTLTRDNTTKLGGVGIPWSHAKVIAVGEDGQELSYNQMGRLHIDTPCKMKEYYNEPQKTKEHYDERGYGISDDMGYVDEDGDVAILGRVTDHIIGENGEKIYNFGCKKIVREDDSVQLCEIVGLPVEDGKKEVFVAHIVLKPEYIGHEASIIDRINQKFDEELKSNERPIGFKFRNAFGITSAGKRDSVSLKKERDEFYNKDVEGNLIKLSIPQIGIMDIQYVDSVENTQPSDDNLTKNIPQSVKKLSLFKRN